MKLRGPMDSLFLQIESSDTPMHIGLIMVFAPPDGAPPNYVDRWVAELRTAEDVTSPWNLKLVGLPFGRFLPIMREHAQVDLDYHLRVHTVAAPGGDAELFDVVRELHSQPLDMHRPLWECHFVDGLERNRFAVYVKVHHGVVDGSSAIRLLLMAMSTDPDTRGMGPFWALAAETEPSSRSALPNPIVAVRRLLSASAQTVGHVVDGSLTLPYVTPNSILRQTLTASRDFAVVDLELAKVKAVAKAAECTLNDLVVYVCATAVRRFLDDRESLPDRPLTAAIPVNLRAEHDNSVGNTIAQIYVSLATNVADPLDRLHTIKRSIDAAKTQMKALPGATSMLYTLLADAPYGLAMLAGLGGRSPVPYSMSISNIPGPKDPVYFNGARMETFYAPAFLMHGGSLIVICTSYVDKLTLTITAANEQLDEVDQMIALLRDAFDEISGLVTNPGAPS